MTDKTPWPTEEKESRLYRHGKPPIKRVTYILPENIDALILQTLAAKREGYCRELVSEQNRLKRAIRWVLGFLRRRAA